MRRLAWSQLRFRGTRLVALLAGIFVATAAFTVLTAAARTEQLRTTGTVSAHFVPAYEILVRPRGARTELERRTGTVQPDFLSGIFGGISLAQWHRIEQIPGVSVAAPIAMVGFTEFGVDIPVTVPAADYRSPGRQLYRISTTWVSQGGTTRIAQPPSYLYVTPNRLRFELQRKNPLVELLPGGGVAAACPTSGFPPSASPFGIAAQSSVDCWSRADGAGTGRPGPAGAALARPGPARYYVTWQVPLLVAAIDPVAEARLDGLNRAVVSGRYLGEDAGARRDAAGLTEFPVLAASSSGMDEYAVTRLQRLAPPARPPRTGLAWMTREAAASGTTIATVTTTAQQAYRKVYNAYAEITTSGAVTGISPLWGYWTVGPVSYRRASSGALVPRTVRNPASAWYTGGVEPPPMDDEDVQYRELAIHTTPYDLTKPHAPALGQAYARVVGTFDAARIRAFDPLSEVPLGLYQPVAAAPGSAASRRALHGHDLLPNQNIGGYVTQPVDLVTTLAALPALESAYYGDGARAADPISAIRVRVAGVTGPDPVSLERIREVAQQIEFRTHLDVDIVAGSSPAPTAIDLPAGRFGRPPLTLTEGWVKEGVAIQILTAVDRNSVALFSLILAVCVLFVANSASVAVRGRQRELGVLSCLGWTRPRLFTTVLG